MLQLMGFDMRRRVRAGRGIAAAAFTAALTLGATGSALAQGQPGKEDGGLASLITETPDAGFALAVKLSQRAVATTQTDPEVRKRLRPAYAHDPNSLIAVSQVVAIHFQTIAAANDYWRE